MIAKLKAGIWVDAQLRLCNRLALPFYVLRRGDGDAGMVLVKVVGAEGAVVVLSPLRRPDETLAWMRATGPEPVDEEAAAAYLARQIDIDPDLWIVEIEDPAGLWQPDAPVV